MVSTRFTISGSVQAVGFRWAAREEATRLGIVGSVRNLRDGRVEADAQGDDEAMAAFAAWLSHGPPYAEVESVQREPIDALSTITFSIGR